MEPSFVKLFTLLLTCFILWITSINEKEEQEMKKNQGLLHKTSLNSFSKLNFTMENKPKNEHKDESVWDYPRPPRLEKFEYRLVHA